MTNPISLITSSVVIGSIPNISGDTSVDTMKSKSLQGFGSIAATYPTQGKLKGTAMVLKQVKKLTKKSKIL